MSDTNSNRPRVFVPTPRPGGGPDAFLLRSYRNEPIEPNALFVPAFGFQYHFDLVSRIEDANLLLLPQPITKVTPEVIAYTKPFLEVAQRLGKPALCFVAGDLSHRLYLEGFTMLKGTQYRRFLSERDLIAPPFCEDLGACGIEVREKRGGKPVVGFCGWADFPSLRTRLAAFTRALWLDLRGTLTGQDLSVFKKGIHFRRLAVRAVQSSPRVEARIVVRSSFSGHRGTISLSPEVARKEYIQNLCESDFALAPKGDANYSVRFFEALSLARVPLLIDTECSLPLEGTIDYRSFILRVPHRDVDRVAEIAADFYAALSPEEFASMQRRAREAFERYLRYDSFFNFIFAEIAAGRMSSLAGPAQEV